MPPFALALGVAPKPPKTTFQIDRFIVLPEALRMDIPANVGLFISLLKDTTLVVVVGLLEILGIGRAVLAQPEWLGASFEVYAFVGVVFFDGDAGVDDVSVGAAGFVESCLYAKPVEHGDALPAASVACA